MVARFEIYLVNLDAEPSDDAKNTRPCVVISPDEMNRHMQNVIIAPLSAPKERKCPTRLDVEFLNGPRSVVLDQIRTVDKARLVKRVGQIEGDGREKILKCLAEMFAE